MKPRVSSTSIFAIGWVAGGALGLAPLIALALFAEKSVPGPEQVAHLGDWVVAEPSFVERQPWRQLFAPVLPQREVEPKARVPEDYDDIPAALAAFPSSEEGTIEVGPGTYLAGALGARRLCIIGRERAPETVLRAAAPGAHVISASPGAKITLRDLTLTGAGAYDVENVAVAVMAVGAEMQLEGCIISGNNLDRRAKYGAALSAEYGGTIEARYCLIIANGAELGTPAVRAGTGGIIKLDHCTVVGNVVSEVKPGFGTIAGTGGGRIEVKHCIVWGNTAPGIGKEPYYNSPPTDYVVTHSAIQGGYEGEGNTDMDPCFRDPFRGDFRLRADTPVPWAGAMPLRER